jgi:NADPH:quinone reductase
LIYGGTGGVGHIALQIANILGANVYVTVANAEQAQLAKSLGAADVIDYKTETVEQYSARLTGGKGFEVVFDTVGNLNLVNAFQAAAINGIVVTTSSSLSIDVSPLLYKGLDFKVISMFLPLFTGQGRELYGQLLAQLIGWINEGRMKVLLDEKQFTFASIGQAHQWAEGGKAIGKVAVSNE